MDRVLQIFRLEAIEIVKLPVRKCLLRQREWPGADFGWPVSHVPNHGGRYELVQLTSYTNRLPVIIM